tara:strand:+ start:300 stop:596 length:297 start_codon:yes stop_codon:yes gene_type:complete
MGNTLVNMAEDAYDDTVGGLIKGVESLIKTGGGSAIYGPGAKPVGPFNPDAPKPPVIPPTPHVTMGQDNQQLKGQQAIQNSLNTANQYGQRFGLAQHF